jgi:hypothetical protein
MAALGLSRQCTLQNVTTTARGFIIITFLNVLLAFSPLVKELVQ